MMFSLSSCVKRHSTQLLPNQSPRTYFWIIPDTGIATGISKQVLRWWGEDPDGFVTGYIVAIVPNLTTIPNPDTLQYFYTKKTDSLINFPLRQVHQIFLVSIRSIDNTFDVILPEGALIKLYPHCYWDKNNNNIFDADDIELPTLMSALDLKGAKQKFPIKNSPPTLLYVPDEADPMVYAEPPKVTFTVASFSWKGKDIDDDETIVSYRISLNDSAFTSPVTVSSSITTITLAVPRSRSDGATTVVDADVLIGTSPNLITIGRLSGLRLNDTNKLYVQAIDIAGDRSEILRFPSKNRTWYVKKPKGKLLVVADYIGGGDSAAVKRYYIDSVFAKIPALQADGFDYINIRIDTTSTRSLGGMVPALQHINPAFIKTLKLYNCVFWYTDAIPSLPVAQYSLYDYWNSDDGGHLIFTTKFTDPFDNHDPAKAFRDFVPIDTLSDVALKDFSGSVVTRFSGYVAADSSENTDLYPPLLFKQRIATGFCVYPIVKNISARYIYYLPSSNYPQEYSTTPVAVMDEKKRAIFITIALERFSATYPTGGGVIEFFKKAFRDFDIYQ